MTSPMLPVPPANRSPKGTGSNLKPDQDISVHHLKADNIAEQGETANVKQNTTNRGGDGAQLAALVSKANTASEVWADTAYRSKANEEYLADNGLRSRIHRKKPQGRSMPANIARAQRPQVEDQGRRRGFFVVQTPGGGMALTRAGSFVPAQGMLRTSAG